MNFVKYFVERRKLCNLLLVFFIIAGAMSIYRLPRQDSPNVNFNLVTIFTFYPGASPEDVEINVTDLLEDELEEVDGIDEMTSFSAEGMSFIFLQLDADSDDTFQIKDDIRAAVDRVTNFPEQVEDRPLINEIKSTDFPILEVAIMGDETQEALIRDIAKDMESEIKSVGKVGAIDKVGYRKREVKILADIAKMKDSYVSFAEMINAIQAHNVKQSGGTLESFVDEKKIVTLSEFENLEDVGDVIIRSNFSGKHVLVNDVALVDVSYEKPTTISRTNGRNSLNLIVKRRGTTDVIDLSKKIDEVVKAYQENYKDKGVEIVKVVDYTYYTNSLLKIVRNNAFIGFVLVIIALFLFLNFHTAVWVGLGIPVSILGAYIFFPLFDITTNQVTLITLIMVLGMLVDDAIVIAENINRHQENGMDFKEAAIVGTKEVAKPVLTTILTTIICFVPIYFMSGILGSFIVAIPTIVILTLGMSLFESVTLLPCHLSYRKSVKQSAQQKFMNTLKEHYGSLLSHFLHHRTITVVVFFAVAIMVGYGFTKVSRFELFPTEDFDLFFIVMEAEEGISLEEMSHRVKEVEKVVHEIPDELMINYKTMVGEHRTDEAASDPALHSNWALISIFLHPASQRDIRSEQLIEELKVQFKDMKKKFTKFDVREMQDGPPVGAPITVNLVSDNFALCEQYEKEIMTFLKEQKGVYDLETTNRVGKKEVQIKLNYDYMARVGITAVDVASAIRVAYDGLVATSVRRSGEEVDFRVMLSEDQRHGEDILKKIQILNNQNALIEIGTFATFEEGYTDQTITHFDGKKAITIKGQVNAELVTAAQINKDLKNKFANKISKTPGISMVFGGEEKQTMESMKNFVMAFCVGLIGIYFILVLLLNSYSQPFLIMIAIPFGFVGVLVAFAFHNLPFSFIGLIGTLGLIGVVVNDSLVMTTYLNDLREKYQRVDIDMIVEGAKTRLRPVLLTTITTVLGLLPTAYGFGGSEPFLVPMVLAMSWGLVFATFITLILVPVLYTFSRKINGKGSNL
ncbi:MAG: efflux RND transporter permease subunit [bacterium]|nr:efflux RND transporter permease subunit [bacterium]